MPKYLIKYGIRGSVFDEEVLIFQSDNETWEYTEVQARELVGCSVERLDPLTEEEIMALEWKVFEASMNLPADRRKAYLQKLLGL